MKEKISSIGLKENTRFKLARIKLNTKSKTMDDVINILIKKYNPTKK